MKNLLLVTKDNVFADVMKSYMPSILPFVLFILLILFHSVSFAQKTWNLTACVEYALNNNIELHQKANELKSQQISLFESKLGMLPDLNLGS